MRKTGRWYRFSQLKYVSELGEDGILHAVQELCGTLGSSSNSRSESSSQTTQDSQIRDTRSHCRREVIDLISDDEESSFASTSQVSLTNGRAEKPAHLHSDDSGSSFNSYAQDETHAKLPELLKCLTVEELKGISRTLKLSNGLTTVGVHERSYCSDSSVCREGLTSRLYFLRRVRKRH